MRSLDGRRFRAVADVQGGDVGPQTEYAQLLEGGRTATGHCESRVEELPDGRLRLHETWAWDSQEGSGTSVVEELP
jgi:hypothetical protein